MFMSLQVNVRRRPSIARVFSLQLVMMHADACQTINALASERAK
jgi:hypothetical protein